MEMPNTLVDLSLENLLSKQALENHTHEQLRYGFSIGELHFVYDASIACELVKAVAIYPVPNTPTWMLGLINLRGALVPVFNLENYFDFKQPVTGHNLLLILGKGEKAIAFQLTDYPILLKNLTKFSVLPKLIPKLEGYVINAYQADEIWLELDKENFFTALGEKVCF